MNERDIQAVIEAVIKEIMEKKAPKEAGEVGIHTISGRAPSPSVPVQGAEAAPQKTGAAPFVQKDAPVPPPETLAAPKKSVKTQEELAEDNGILIESPEDMGALIRMKAHTPARIGVGKAGPRLKTKTLLKLRADHAAARDAVFTDADPAVLKNLNLPEFKTLCKDKNEYLTRPDLGRQLEKSELDRLASAAGKNKDVLIYASDGLSSTAINKNLENILPVLTEGLTAKGLKLAAPFFLKYGRVGAMDAIGDATGASVVCVLIGERPGLATAESMSAYIAYKPTVGMPEARRTVVSNIHKGGTAAVEAGAYISDIIETIYKAKASGVELRRESGK